MTKMNFMQLITIEVHFNTSNIKSIETKIGWETEKIPNHNCSLVTMIPPLQTDKTLVEQVFMWHGFDVPVLELQISFNGIRRRAGRIGR